MSILRYDVVRQKNMVPFSPELLYLSKARFENDLHATMHFHQFTEIFFIIGGSGEMIHANKSYKIKKGDICIVNPNNIHTESSHPDNILEYLLIAVNHIELDYGEDNAPIFNFEKHFDILNFYFGKILTELSQKNDYYQDVIQSALIDILVIILRQIGAVTKKIETRLLSKECEVVKNYIDSHYTMPLNLDKIAKIAFISKGYLIRSFKKHMGISPMTYLREKRICEAKVILRTSDFAVADIGLNIGFSNPSHFIQTFRQIVGCTPNEYRIKCANSEAEE